MIRGALKRPEIVYPSGGTGGMCKGPEASDILPLEVLLLNSWWQNKVDEVTVVTGGLIGPWNFNFILRRKVARTIQNFQLRRQIINFHLKSFHHKNKNCSFQ
jgi:hypothetical protein